VLFGGLGIVFLFGLPALGVGGGAQAAHWLGLARGPWALPIVVAAFAALAFLGVPQVVLIGAAVLAFGPWTGTAYSWTGTMVSALTGFGLGRLFGARLLDDLSGPTPRRLTRLVGRNGFIASLAVRLAPFAPFVLVNMAAGVTPMGLGAFTLGTAIGIVPKIAVIAFAGHSVMAGGAASLVWLGVALAVWLAAGLLGGRWLKREPRG
jgi:uncharacterized membrane protein YdjX (TVP38/TMEM64 family)